MSVSCRSEGWGTWVLIAPLWNWNGAVGLHTPGEDGSNRTFMELKLGDQHTVECPNLCSNRTFMELKFSELSPRPKRRCCSNRTFMELKSGWAREEETKKGSSNRTFMELKSCSCFTFGPRTFSSNRTFMELKYRQHTAMAGGDNVLIAPLWNWNRFLLGRHRFND